MSTERLPTLLRELSQHGFAVLAEEPDQAVIRDEHENLFVLTGADEWVQASQMVLEAAELQGPAYNEVTSLALRLHSRFLGCRLGFDDEQNLAVQYDVYPDATVEHVILALGQVHYVASVAHELCRLALSGGTIDDDRIDRAFDDA